MRVPFLILLAFPLSISAAACQANLVTDCSNLSSQTDCSSSYMLYGQSYVNCFWDGAVCNILYAYRCGPACYDLASNAVSDCAEALDASTCQASYVSPGACGDGGSTTCVWNDANNECNAGTFCIDISGC